MKLVIGAVATALVLATGAGFNIEVKAAEDPSLVLYPPDASTITPELADMVCSAVSNAGGLDTAEQTRIGHDAAALIRDYGDTDPASSAVIEACVAGGPTVVLAAYNGGEVTEVASLAIYPPDAKTITPEFADVVCNTVSNAGSLDIDEQARIGRDIAALIRDYGDTDPASSAIIEACVAGGPTGIFAAYNGSEVAQVGEGTAASEQ